MSAAVLADTNVLVYWMDAGGGRRHARAVELFDSLGLDRVRLSTQILSEFASVMTHPRKLAMEPATAADVVMAMSDSCEILPVEPRTVVAALRARDRWQLAHYDAQIWATAALNNVPVVLSEDFSSGTTLEGVTFLDPFAGDFDLESL